MVVCSVTLRLATKTEDADADDADDCWLEDKEETLAWQILMLDVF